MLVGGKGGVGWNGGVGGVGRDRGVMGGGTDVLVVDDVRVSAGVVVVEVVMVAVDDDLSA